MQLTLGPVLFHWPPDTWRDFYFRIADEAPIDVVALGEVVCSKRAPFVAEVMPAVIERLEHAGKKALRSSLALITLERERRSTAALGTSGAMVEANDIACLPHLAGIRHAIGPFVNVYNEATAEFLAGRGAARICLPPELPASSIASICAAVPDVVVEVQVFGRIPLALSARCYHARQNGLSKDNCRFVCGNDADGLAVETLDGEPFVALNGVQTLSHTCGNLICDLDQLAICGVRSCRLSPQSCDMVAVAQAFRDVLDGHLHADDGLALVTTLFPGAKPANGFFFGRPGAEWFRPTTPRQFAPALADRECARRSE